MADSAGARDAQDARAFALLEAVYSRYANRYGRAGLPLAGFAGRWLALRLSTAGDAAALAVLDETPEAFGDDFARFRRAAIGRAESQRLVFVRLRRARTVSILGAAREVGERLSISVSPSAGPWGLLGGVELDAACRAVAPTVPVPVSLLAS